MAKLIHYTDSNDGKNKSGTLESADVPTSPHSHNASEVPVSTANFNKNLASTDDTVQKALDKLDDMSTGAALPAGANNSTLRHNGTAWDASSGFKIKKNLQPAPNWEYGFFSPGESGYRIPAALLTVQDYLNGNGYSGITFRASSSSYTTFEASTYNSRIQISNSNGAYLSIISGGTSSVAPLSISKGSANFQVTYEAIIQSSAYRGVGNRYVMADQDGNLRTDLQPPMRTIASTKTIPTSSASQEMAMNWTFAELGISSSNDIISPCCSWRELGSPNTQVFEQNYNIFVDRSLARVRVVFYTLAPGGAATTTMIEANSNAIELTLTMTVK